ncbi:hypothetical protein CPB84DRAFT_1958754 [Gymnopilus junonius]|uniref:Uncharacterized protein n=1 Tax=Gymnopilus junonius TaxID=109634 RepID=A0A9P5P008_GYMJU|nr:hypothetical protein CPB84DRAFT_1958754 [Gymnopilus junonius]
MSESVAPKSRTAFISGPIEFPDDFFATYYEPLLKEAISSGHSFVVGPAPGTDTMALKYLLDHDVELSRITVYLTEFEERTLADRVNWFTELGGHVKVEGVTTSDRDTAMTRDSDYDILEYMTIEEQKVFYGERYFPRVSATEKNDRRRKGLPLHVNHGLAGYELQDSYRPETQNSKGLGFPRPKIWKKRIEKIFSRSSTTKPE